MKRTDPKSVNQIIDEYLSHEGLTATVDEQRAAYLLSLIHISEPTRRS